MAYEGQQITLGSLIAGADLSTHQYKFVELTAANTVGLCDATADIPLGVLQNAPIAGQPAEVCILGITKLKGTADLAFNARVGPNTDGQAIAATSTYVSGVVIVDNSAAGGVATVFLHGPTLR